MKSNSNAKPAAFLPLGDGSFHYNHKVQEVEVVPMEGQPLPKTKKAATAYDYEVARFWGAPTYEAVVKAVVREKYSESQEFALINAYNAFVLGLSDDPADKAEYEAYLTELVAIKAMVKQDLADYEAAK
jgi:hypothetical protein